MHSSVRSSRSHISRLWTLTGSASLPLAASIATALTLGSSAIGATVTFTGSGTTWDQASDWSSGLLPAVTDDLLFNNGFATTLDGSFTVRSLSFNIGSGTTSIDANATGTTGQTLTLAGDVGGTDALGNTGMLIDLGSTTTGTVNIGATSGTGTTTVMLGTYGILNIGNASATLNFGANSIISGAFNLSKSGAGTLILAGANTFGGSGRSFTLNSGTLDINNATALGNASNTFVINGGTIDNTSGASITTSNYAQTWNGSFTFNGSNALNLGTGAVTLTTSPTITVNGTGALTVGGAISGAGFGLTKSGNGTLTLTGANTYTGPTVVNAGLLNVTSAGTATVNSAGITGAGSVSYNAASITLNGNASSNGGNLSFTATSTSALYSGIYIAGAAEALTTTGGGAITLVGDIGNEGANGHTLTLDTSNGNGTINLNLSVGRSSHWYALTSFSANAGTGTINWTGTNGSNGSQGTPITLTGAINFSSNFVAQSALTMTLNATGPSTVSGVLSGPLSLVAGGTNTLSLVKANTYTGATTVNAGTLELDFSASGAPASNIINNTANSSALVLGGGTLLLNGGGAANSQRFNGLTLSAGASSIQLVPNATTPQSLALTLGSVTRSLGGTVDFTLPSGSGSSTNGVVITNGTAGSILTSGNVAYATVGATDWAAMDPTGAFVEGLSNIGGGYTPSTPTTLSGNADVAIGTTNTTLGSNTVITSLRFNQPQPTTIALGTNTLTTGGILVTSAPIDVSSITGGKLMSPDLVIKQFNANQTLSISSVIANMTPISVTTTNASASVTTADTSNLIVGMPVSGTGIPAGATIASITNSTTFTLSANANATGTNNMTTANGVTITGPGVVSLLGANTYTGTTFISGGNLDVANQAALQTTTLNSTGGTVIFDQSVSGNAFTFGGLSGTGNIGLTNNAATPAAITLTVGGTNASTTYSGIMSGAGSLTKAGTGTLALNGANTYTGVTMINAGILSTNNLAAAGSPSGLGASAGDASNLVFGAQTAVLSYTGSVAGTLLRGFTLSSGTSGGATLSSDGTGAFLIDPSIVINYGTANQTRTLTLAGSNTGANTFGATLTNNGSSALTLVKKGYSNWTLTQSNTFTGAVNIQDNSGNYTSPNAGALILNCTTGKALPNVTAINVGIGNGYNIGGVLELLQNEQLNDSAVVSLATYHYSKNSIFELMGNNQVVGGLVGSGGGNGPGTIIMQNGGTGNSTLTINIASAATTYSYTFGNVGKATIQDGGTGKLAIDKEGLGTEVFGHGNFTYTGGTTINGGTLQFGNGSSGGALPTGPMTVNTPGTLVFNRGDSVTFGPAITGTGNVTQNGTAGTTLTLTGVNTYTGNTTISGGTLELAPGSALASSLVTVNAGTLRVDSTGIPLNGLIMNNAASGLALVAAPGQTTNAAAFQPSTNFAVIPMFNGLPTAGTINLLTAGTVAGTATPTLNLTNFGATRVAGSVALNGNMLQLTVTTGAANLVWNNGSSTGNWSVNTTTDSNFLNVSSNDVFMSYDAVTFDNSAVTPGTVTLVGTLAPSAVSVANATGTYVFGGSGSIVGGGSLTKSGAGILTVSTANTFVGGTTLNGGQLNINNASAIGLGTLTIAGGTIDNTTGGAITLTTNNAQVWSGDFTFNGTKALNLGTGSVSLGASRTVTVNGTGGALTVGGTISDSGNGFGLTVAGTGALVLAGANTYRGTTTMTNGTLTLSSPNGPAIPGNVTFGNGSTTINPTINTTQPNQFGSGSVISFINGVGGYTRLQLAGNNQTLAGLSGSTGGGVVQNSGYNSVTATQGATLTINTPSGTSYSYNGYLRDTDGGTNANGISLIKTGAGTQTLAGTNTTYTGSTAVNGGTLLVAGSISGSTTTVNSGGTLGGTGTTGAVTVTSGGTLLPGSLGTLGTLSTKAVTFNGGGIFSLQINTSSVNGSNVVASSIDAITGNLTLGTTAPTLAISDLGGGLTLAIGDTIPFATYTGTWDGNLFSVAGSAVPNGGTFNVGPNAYRLTYNGGATNNTVLLTVVPEPGAYASLLGGLATLAGLQRFRRRRF